MVIPPLDGDLKMALRTNPQQYRATRNGYSLAKKLLSWTASGDDHVPPFPGHQKTPSLVRRGFIPDYRDKAPFSSFLTGRI
jgi:hypothetical protein